MLYKGRVQTYENPRASASFEAEVSQICVVLCLRMSFLNKISSWAQSKETSSPLP